jgi:hypothetical protein
MKGSFPFFTFCNADKVISMIKVNFGIDAGPSQGIKEIKDERKGISVFLGDFVEPTVVYT